MNVLDNLLADTSRVGGLAPTAIEKGRAELDEAVRALQNSGGGLGSAGRSRRRIGLVSAAAFAASAAVVVALTIGSNQSETTHPATGASNPAAGNSGAITSDNPSPTTNIIELAGYRLALPSNYILGKNDTNCTVDLHLSADETKRLVTTPDPGCPLLVTSVQRDLPPDASNLSVDLSNSDGTTVASFIGWSSEQTNEAYLPTKLPDGTTVYVTLAGIGGRPDQANGVIDWPAPSITQLQEFEQGVTVAPTS